MTQDTAASIGGQGRYRRWLLTAGVLISAVSCVYLVLYVYRHWSELPPLSLTWTVGGWLLASCALYFVGHLTTACAWFYALRALGRDTPARSALGVTLLSQIGKYAPGNVAHHIGRAALASSHGVPLATTAKASLMEIAVAVAAGLLATAIGSLLSPEAFNLLTQVKPDWPVIAVMGAIAAATVALAAMGLAIWLKRAQKELRWSRQLAAGAWRMLGCYCLSFLFAGASYWAVTRAFGQSMDLAFCVAVFALAWVVGFITPGAPAGLGVRESILIIATTGSLGSAAVSVAIVHRLATAISDAAGAAAGALALSPGKAAHDGR